MEEDKPVKIKDGSIVVENKIFRIAGRLLAFTVLVVYLTMYFQAKNKGLPFDITSFDIGLISIAAIAVFAIEYLRYLAKKKIG